jgi:chromosome segregation ATPase
MSMRLARLATLVLLATVSGACRSSGSFLVFGGSGAPQVDLVEQVHAAGEEARATHRDFATAFQLYQRLTSPQAVELEELSDDFEDAIESCAGRAEDLAERLESVRKEEDELVQGWNDELTHFSGDTMRKKSEAMLRETEARAQRVRTALEHAQASLQPVLLKLQDYALFFHHNLNARAIATLQDTYKDFDAEFRALESEFTKAEMETTAFLANFVEPPASEGLPAKAPGKSPAKVSAK